MILDATAGNRHMWKNKDPDNIIFLDKEIGLRVSPDIFAVWRYLPFRNNSFNCIIFDPPYLYPESNQFNRDPKAKPHGQKRIPGWYGAFKSKQDIIIHIIYAQREFARVSSRLCFKWNISSISLWNILGLFDCWSTQFKVQVKALRSKNTWWVKFIRRED